MSATVNSKASAKKKKPRGKPFAKTVNGVRDERINLKGAPVRGASLKEIYDFYDGLTAEETAAMLPPGPLRQAYMQMPKGVAMKHLKVIRINAAIMFDPTPGLVNAVHDRTDGKVSQPVQVQTETPLLIVTKAATKDDNGTDPNA